VADIDEALRLARAKVERADEDLVILEEPSDLPSMKALIRMSGLARRHSNDAELLAQALIEASERLAAAQAERDQSLATIDLLNNWNASEREAEAKLRATLTAERDEAVDALARDTDHAWRSNWEAQLGDERDEARREVERLTRAQAVTEQALDIALREIARLRLSESERSAVKSEAG